MTSTAPKHTEPFNLGPVPQPQAGAGRFMLTLCRLSAPVSIRQPQSPQLKPFTFFMSRVQEPDGGQRLYLHMGYFDTLAHAERWAESVRRRYPSAFATIAPVAQFPAGDSQAPIPASVAGQVTSAQNDTSVAPKTEQLSDTQVLRILETRGGPADLDELDGGRTHDQIALLRPDDTVTRQALKEAVVQGTPVSFAVQLHWSSSPIDLSRVPPLAIFKAHTLYATESCRRGRSRHFLRLGFFADPISAKQVAAQALTAFASAAVVPVLDQEATRAREVAMGRSVIPYLVDQRAEDVMDPNGTAGSSVPSRPQADSPRRPFGAPEIGAPPEEASSTEDMWSESDTLSESGVRHLRVQVQDNSSGRWKVVKLRAAPVNMVQIYS